MSPDTLEEIDADLARHMEGAPHEPGEELDDVRADELVFARARLLARRGHVLALSQARRTRIAEWEAEQLESIDASVTSIETDLSSWIEAVRRRQIEEGRKPSAKLDLPHGVVRSTPEQPRWVFGEPDKEDFTEFRTWVIANRPDVLKPWSPPAPPCTDPDKNKVKAAFEIVGLEDAKPGDRLAVRTQGGEVVPGVSVIAPGRGLKVER